MSTNNEHHETLCEKITKEVAGRDLLVHITRISTVISLGLTVWGIVDNHLKEALISGLWLLMSLILIHTHDQTKLLLEVIATKAEKPHPLGEEDENSDKTTCGITL